ncbi:MAG: DCC1-like thiol-disulfide oxidoreductase family protein [Bacteriovoracales bacterium]|nr:DCC1-like thiol-disulfide oxidoreductase family protein [Bacteriovoracales bacterium]
MKALILDNLTTFRFLLFVCACSYALIAYYWLKPTSSQLKAGLIAMFVQFWTGLLFDAGLVELGFWIYHPMSFTALNVPIDLHLNWAILWGLGICWLFEKWPGANATPAKFFIYMGAWVFLTLSFDMMMVDWMIFLEKYSPHWWIADIAILTSVQGFTLWFYKSINRTTDQPCQIPLLPIIAPYVRSLVYLSFLICLFFIYIPEQINVLMAYFDLHPKVYHFDKTAYPLLFISVALGGWATHEFAKKGEGTPIPLDDPKFLVVTGPYLFFPNPMQISGILLTLSILLFNFHWANLLYLLDVVLVVYLIFEHFESIHLKEHYGRFFQMSASWKITLTPKRLDQVFRPTLFIDSQCPLCLRLAELLRKFDLSQNIEIKSLDDISEGHGHHGPLKALADTKTTLILAEPRIPKGGRETRFLYSTKGRAVLRLFGHLPMPFCFIAAYEGLPGVVPLINPFYSLVARLRKCEIRKT